MGSTISELVAREAEEAERDDDATEPGAEPEAEPTPDTEPGAEPAPAAVPAPEPPSEAQLERAMKAIEKAGDRYTKSIQQIQEGVDLGLVECPLCPVPGFVSELPPPEGFDPTQVQVVLTYLGVGPTRAYKQAPHLGPCPDCDARGFWATGSQREGYTDVQCDTCLGSGFVDTRHLQALAPAAPMTPPEGAAPYLTIAPDMPTGLQPSQVSQGGHTFQLVPGAASDQHGRLPGHPLWGQPIEMGGI